MIISEKSRSEIRQKKLWDLGLIEWSELENYTWQTDAEADELITSKLPLFIFRPSDLRIMVRKPSTLPHPNRLLLKIKYRKRQRPSGYLIFAIAPNRKNAIDDVLRHYLPATT